MDVFFSHLSQNFEWDARKAASNLDKHRLAFEEACQVFLDPFVRCVDAGVQEEARKAAIGMTEAWVMLFVVHLVKKEATIRIISARPATPSERRVYQNE